MITYLQNNLSLSFYFYNVIKAEGSILIDSLNHVFLSSKAYKQCAVKRRRLKVQIEKVLKALLGPESERRAQTFRQFYQSIPGKQYRLTKETIKEIILQMTCNANRISTEA